MKTGHAIPSVDQCGASNPNNVGEKEIPTYPGLGLGAWRRPQAIYNGTAVLLVGDGQIKHWVGLHCEGRLYLTGSRDLVLQSV